MQIEAYDISMDQNGISPTILVDILTTFHTLFICTLITINCFISGLHCYWTRLTYLVQYDFEYKWSRKSVYFER